MSVSKDNTQGQKMLLLNLTGGPQSGTKSRKNAHTSTGILLSALWLLGWGHFAPPHPHHDGGSNLLIPRVR